MSEIINVIKTIWEYIVNGWQNNKIPCLAIIGLIVLAVTLSIIRGHSTTQGTPKAIRKDICKRKFYTVEGFRKRWITGPQQGLKYKDHAGCYVILIFDRPAHGHYEKYKDVYVGQSVHVNQRVMNHLSGKGNGDVYADIKNGRYVYITTIKCRRGILNDMEKSLIRAFKATASYNRTGGGSKQSW